MSARPDTAVPSVRIRTANEGRVRTDGNHVLYWMIAARRPSFNFGLQRAADWARHLGRPLVVLEALACGTPLNSYELVYETYGELNASASNAVLICHALSGHHHAAGYHSADDRKPGWWDNCIGPGKAIDTNRFFVICPNIIGGCMGSSGPASIDPATGKPYRLSFPMLRLEEHGKRTVFVNLDRCDRIHHHAERENHPCHPSKIVKFATFWPTAVR